LEAACFPLEGRKPSACPPSLSVRLGCRSGPVAATGLNPVNTGVAVEGLSEKALWLTDCLFDKWNKSLHFFR